MLRTLFLFLLGLMIFQLAKAQKPDTVLLYMDNSNRIVETKDSADYFLRIVKSKALGKNVMPNRITEFYKTGVPKLDGMAYIYMYNNSISLKFIGLREDFSTEGYINSISNYDNGIIQDEKLLYPNGKLYVVEYLKNPANPLLIECYNSAGVAIAKEGNGNWVKFDKDFKWKTEEGPVKDSLQDGEWHIIRNDSTIYKVVYNHGEIVSSTDPDQVFNKVDVEPKFKAGGPLGFNQFLAQTFRYPVIDRENGIQGKIILTFVVEKNGTLSNIKALSGPTQSIMDAGIKTVQQSPAWNPGIKNGKPVRSQFTMSFSFRIAEVND